MSDITRVHKELVARILEGDGRASHAQRRAAFDNAGLAGVSLPDIMAREGIHPETPRLPFTPGWDPVGVVDRLGDGNPFRFIEIIPLPAPSKGTCDNQQNSGIPSNRVHRMRVTGDLVGE